MKKIITAAFILCALAVFSFGQTSVNADASLEAAMQKFRSSISSKNTKVFLSFISPAKGLTIMNTIDQGEAGNEDKPMLDSELKYATLAADFKKKGDIYQNFFVKSPDSPSLFDNFTGHKEKWTLGADNKFMPLDKADGTPFKAIYVKWEKQGSRWFAVEIGRPIS